MKFQGYFTEEQEKILKVSSFLEKHLGIKFNSTSELVRAAFDFIILKEGLGKHDQL